VGKFKPHIVTAEKERRLQEARTQELEIRKKMRELEEQGKTAELEIARGLDEERQQIKQKQRWVASTLLTSNPSSIGSRDTDIFPPCGLPCRRRSAGRKSMSRDHAA